MTLWEFFNSTAGGATILGGMLAVARYVSARQTNRLIAQMHTDTQTTLGQMLDRMDQAAEARYRDLKDRLDAEGRGDA